MVIYANKMHLLFIKHIMIQKYDAISGAQK